MTPAPDLTRKGTPRKYRRPVAAADRDAGTNREARTRPVVLSTGRGCMKLTAAEAVALARERLAVARELGAV